jgi:sugar/nucleoside kinase (ribokinase family)
VGPLAVVGHTTRDVIDSRPPRAGGPPLYAARALAALGDPALVVTRCAQADEPLLAPLRALRLPVVWRAEARSAVFRLEYRGGERAASIEALGEPWSAGDARGWLAEALGDADWVHAGALWRGDFPAETLAELARGRRLSLDGQGLVRPGRVGPVEPDADFDPAVLEHVDLLHLSEPEAATLGLSLDRRSLGSLGVREIVVTLGGRGSVVFAGRAAEAVPARPLRGVDPTGAGDAFTAAYVACRRRGQAPARAARRATEVVRALLSGRLRA